MLISDPKNIKDSDLTLQDVVRAKKIVDRANRIILYSVDPLYGDLEKTTHPTTIDTMSWSIAPSKELDAFVEKIINS